MENWEKNYKFIVERSTHLLDNQIKSRRYLDQKIGIFLGFTIICITLILDTELGCISSKPFMLTGIVFFIYYLYPSINWDIAYKILSRSKYRESD